MYCLAYKLTHQPLTKFYVFSFQPELAEAERSRFGAILQKNSLGLSRCYTETNYMYVDYIT